MWGSGRRRRGREHPIRHRLRGVEGEGALGLADVVAAHRLDSNLGDELTTVVHPQRLALSLNTISFSYSYTTQSVFLDSYFKETF